MADPDNSISVSTGSSVVEGTLTSFVAAEGDILVCSGVAAVIAQRTSPSEIVLKQPWPGATATGITAWNIVNTGPYWQSTVATNLLLNSLLKKFDAGPVKWDASGTLDERAGYNNQPKDFVYLSVNPLPFRLYVKLANTNSSVDWSEGQILGDRGPVALEEAIALEQAQRLQADSDITTRIDNLQTSFDPNLRTDLLDEIARAMAAEQALSNAGNQLGVRTARLELVTRILRLLTGEEGVLQGTGSESGYQFLVRTEDGRFTGAFAIDAVVAQALRLLDGTKLSSGTNESGYLLAVRDSTGRDFGGIAADGFVANLFRLMGGGGVSTIHPETGLEIGFGNRARRRSGVAWDGAVEAPRVLIEKSTTALRDAGAGFFSARDSTGRLLALLDYEGRIDGEMHRRNLVESTPSGILLPVEPSRNIACWGTSQTQGQQPLAKAWPEHLRDLFAGAGDPRLVANNGAGGQNSSQIVGRMGGKPVTVTLDGNAITYGQDTLVTAMEPRILTPGWDKIARATLAGVKGLFFRNGLDAQGNDAIYFHPDPTGSSGTVPCPAGTAFTVNTSRYRRWTTILDLVQNIPNKDRKTWRADAISAMRAQLVSNPRTLFLGGSLFADSLPPNAGPSTGRTPQYPGTPDYRAFREIHEEMRRLLGDRFFDMHRYLVDYGMADAVALGLLPSITDGDRADVANDFVPRSLRWDELHFNTIAHYLIALEIFHIIIFRGW